MTVTPKLRCRFHPKNTLELFCEGCTKSMCIDCRNRGHTVSALQIKTQETEEKLKYFLSEGQNEEQVIWRRCATVKKKTGGCEEFS